MHLRGIERWARQQERNRHYRDQEREAVRKCREGNLADFRSLIYPVGETSAENRFGVSPEEFREWERLTAQQG